MPVPTWMTEAGIIGTWVVGILALFGDRIRAWCFQPKLHLELKSDVGKYTPQTARENGREVTRHARYYHLRVTNRAKYPKADDVQVLLLGAERINDPEQRQPRELLYVPLTLGWAGGVYPITRPIGSKTEGVADLLFVRDDGLQFLPVVLPLNFQAKYEGETHLRVTAIAQGLNCESNILQLTVDWDGEWVRDDNVMRTHFRISPGQAEA